MKMFLSTLSVVVALLMSSGLYAQTPVIVGMTDAQQAPLTFADGSGLARDVTAALNTIQTKYQFVYQIMPTVRLEKDLEANLIHIAAFHNIFWGWDAQKVDKSYDLLAARDVFVTLKGAGKDEAYFDGVGTLKMVGVLGFAYTFVNFETDQKILKDKYHLNTVNDEMTVLKMLLDNRGEIGIMSSMTLDYLKSSDNDTYEKLLISERADSEYVRHYILSKQAPITVQEFNALLRQLATTGTLATLYAKDGLTVPTLPEE